MSPSALGTAGAIDSTASGSTAWWPEGDLAGEDVVEGAAQRIDVAARVDRARMPRLLWRDVVERPHGGAVAGDLLFLGQVDGEAEVRQLGRPVARDQDVERVDVAVDQPLLLGVLEPERHLADQPRGGARWHRAVLGDDRPEVLALDELHHEVALAVRFPLVVDPDEVLVLELGADPRLALEARDGPRVIDALGREDLDGDPPVQPRILGEVDPAHPPLPDHLEQDVAVDLEAGRPPRQELLRLPEREQLRLDGLPGQPAVELIGHALLGRKRLEAGRQPLEADQAALERRLPEP